MPTRIFKQAPQEENFIGLFDSYKPWRTCTLPAARSPAPILVIDDDVAILSLMGIYLKKAGEMFHPQWHTLVGF